MLSQAEATIYLASQRGCSQKEWHRSYHTFNFGAYFNESRKSFAGLQVVNDDTLRAGGTLTLEVTENALILLLPITGTLNYQNYFESGSVEVGQCYQFFTRSGTSFKIANPYDDELINFLQIWIKTDTEDPPYISGKSEFDLKVFENQLIPLQTNEEENAMIFIGKFAGRKEGMFQLTNPKKGVFVFVIEGAFEVENRLLQARDGLTLKNTSQIEFEALSNNAILLIVEN